MTDPVFRIVIPARFQSQRLPGKPLLEINNKPIIQYVYENALASGALSVTIATDDERIAECADRFEADICMTSIEHRSGTDRIAEVCEERGWRGQEIVVNVQGDEPEMSNENIRQLAELLDRHEDAQIATLCWPITDEVEAQNPNIVKAAYGEKQNALYFSRSPIPYHRDPSERPLARHIGIYAYRVDYLKRFVNYPATSLEKTECLEQLRALEHGDKIVIEQCAIEPGIGVDTREDYEALKCRLAI